MEVFEVPEVAEGASLPVEGHAFGILIENVQRALSDGKVKDMLREAEKAVPEPTQGSAPLGPGNPVKGLRALRLQRSLIAAFTKS